MRVLRGASLPRHVRLELAARGAKRAVSPSGGLKVGEINRARIIIGSSKQLTEATWPLNVVRVYMLQFNVVRVYMLYNNLFISRNYHAQSRPVGTFFCPVAADAPQGLEGMMPKQNESHQTPY